jgi:hypothetical protein
MPRSNKSSRGSIKVAVRNLRRCTIAQSDLIDKFEKYQRRILAPGRRVYGSGLDETNGYAIELSYLRLRKSAVEDLIASAERYRDAVKPERSSFLHAANSLLQTCKGSRQ